MAFEQDVPELVNRLPRAVSTLADEVHVLFVGTDLPDRNEMWHKRVLRVRRRKVLAAIQWLVANNPRYADCVLDEAALAELPDDEDGQIPDSIWSNVKLSKSTRMHVAATAGYVQDPAKSVARNGGPQESKSGSASSATNNSASDSKHNSASSSPSVSGERKSETKSDHAQAPRQQSAGDMDESDDTVQMSTSGLIDVNASSVSAQAVHSAGIKNSFPSSAIAKNQTLFYVHMSETPASELRNPRYLELAFPTLYPWGRGGFDFTILKTGPKRRSALSVENYARHCLTLGDPRFRLHHTWMFIISNLMNRRTVARRASAHAQTKHFVDDIAKINELRSEYVSIQLLCRFTLTKSTYRFVTN